MNKAQFVLLCSISENIMNEIDELEYQASIIKDERVAEALSDVVKQFNSVWGDGDLSLVELLESANIKYNFDV